MISKSHSILLTGATAFLLLSGCTAAFLNTAAHGIFTQEEINFREKNYAAADYLIGQAQTYINRHRDYIYAEPLGDAKQPQMQSDLGMMIPEQIGVRMSQLGYLMNLERVATSPDTNYLKPSADTRVSPDFVLTGSYMRHDTEMEVSVRLVDAKSARVIAAFDYMLPLTRQINAMASPEPRIIRMQQVTPAPAIPVPPSPP